MLFKLPVFILCCPLLIIGLIIHDSPAMEKWDNSLDSLGKVEKFLHSNAAFGREVVTIVEEEGQPKQPTLGGKYPLIQGLERILKNRKDHQVMLVFNTARDYKESVKSLTLMRHKWIWLNFPIEQGPQDRKKPIAIQDFNAKELDLMKDFQLAFGFTSDPYFGRGEYLHEHVRRLANATDTWYTRLGYSTDFIVELSLHIFLNSSDNARVWQPLLDRTMFISFCSTNRDEKLVVRQKGTMGALAKMLGKERMYLNIPDNVHLLLNPQDWFGETKGGGTGLEINCFVLFYSLLLMILGNKLIKD